MTQDTIFATDQDGKEPFRFNSAVADVFPDMLKRSIPGYAASIEAIGSLAARYVTEGSLCYDLGCSLGGASIAMRQGIRVPGCRIIAIDNAPAMLKRCEEIVAAEDQSSATPIEIRLANIEDTDISNASMVSGIRLLQSSEASVSNGLVAGISLICAIGVPLHVQYVLGDPWLSQLPTWARLITTNPVVLGVLLAVSLNAVLNLGGDGNGQGNS